MSYGGARRLLLLAVCAVLMLGCSAASTGPGETASASSPADTLGVYHGPADAGGVAYFQQRLGRRIGYVHDYLDRRSWAAIENVQWLTRHWAAAGYGKRMVLTVPMLPDKGGDMAGGAAGRYNAHFRTLAEQLVRGGLGSAVLRVAPEFNGQWFKWRIDGRNGPQNFIAFWRHIVNTMNSVPGANFKYDWCPNAGSAYIGGGKQVQAASAWPGDEYVDFVGLDVFDQSWAPGRKDAVKRWNEYVNQHDGMAWHAAFAAAHGKPMTFPEWGLVDRMDGHGGGDNPYFIRQMHDWIQSHDVAYHLYFENYDPNADYGIFSGWFPKSANTFIDLFGSRAGVGAGIGRNDYARLRISSPQMKRGGRRFRALTRFSKRASGEARVQLSAGGRKIRFTARLRGGKGRLKLGRKISRRMARSGKGVMTFVYGGDADTHSQRVTMRIGPSKPQLRVWSRAIIDGRLRASGQVSRPARGSAVVQLSYVVDAQIVTRSFAKRIRNGRWRLNMALSNTIRAEIGRRQGPVVASLLYTGQGRTRGELRSSTILGPR